MLKNKKIELLIVVLLLFIICIFGLGLSLEEFESSNDAGWELHPDDNNRHMGSDNTTYSYSNKTVTYKIIKEDGIEEIVEKVAIDYKEYVDEAIVKWINEGKSISGDGDYIIIEMEEIESNGMGTIAVEYNENKRRLAKVDVYYNENDPNEEYLITSWTLTINVAKFDKKDAGGTDKYSYEDKILILAHEIGHIYGIADLDDNSQIMNRKYSSIWSITEKDIHGMEVCTEAHIEHNFDTIIYEDKDYCTRICSYCGGYIKIPHEFTSNWITVGTEDICQKLIYTCNLCGYSYESAYNVKHQFTPTLVPVGTQDTCQKTVRTCSLCGYSYVTYWDHTHTWTDKYDATCNDCGYTKTVAVEEVDGLLTATIHGQSWILNFYGSSAGFQYKSSYTLPNGGTLTWNNIGDGAPYNKYCYNYNGKDYTISDYRPYDPLSFAQLREMTKVQYEDYDYNYYKLRYILDRLDLRYRPQYIQTTETLEGGFYAQLLGNEVNSYYVKIYRVLLDGSGNKTHYAEVWSLSMQIPVYFSQ